MYVGVNVTEQIMANLANLRSLYTELSSLLWVLHLLTDVPTTDSDSIDLHKNDAATPTYQHIST